jgi:hypothetical protein
MGYKDPTNVVRRDGSGKNMDQYRHRLAQFATGMNGDEDLGQNIIMKGDKYHYYQALFATGMNGDEDLGQNIIMKGDKYHYNQSLAQGSDYHYNNSMGYRDPTNVVKRDGSGKDMGQYRHRLSQFATGMNGDEDLG